MIGKFRYLEIEDSPQEFLVENSLINLEFLKIKTGEITARAHSLCIAETLNSVQEIGGGALLVATSHTSRQIVR